MGIWDLVTDLAEAAIPWSTVEAEAPAAEDQAEEATEETSTKAEESAEASAEAEPEAEAEAEEAEEEEEEEEDEEEDEEETVDPKEKLEEECKQSKVCAEPKHHFDECVERVTAAEGESGPKEDCVEEFFHLAHCATTCAAPKLWAQLK
ncbi:hypothetical protein ACRALDRAFT_1064005 [Sodiomyces alcalophilus JCM 7366]|uniref:uncharacterized protein n=1 Tax=Sodiomyces alcalophilus JCM 7366 TaxID=591952 RepID=UPI0039B4CA6D